MLYDGKKVLGWEGSADQWLYGLRLENQGYASPVDQSLITFETLEEAREFKRGEFAWRALKSMQALYPDVASVDGGWVAEALIALATNNTTQRQQLIDIVAKRKRGVTNANSKTTIADVIVLRWEDQ